MPREAEPSEEPLLTAEEHGQREPSLPVLGLANSKATGAGFALSVVILSKTILGAGMAALPRAFVLLGVVTALAFLLLCAWLTHFSVEALTVGTLATGHMSYPEVVHSLCGRPGSMLLELSLILRCSGLMVVYEIVAADVLAGGHDMRGLLCDLTGQPEGLCSNRPLVAGLVTVLFFAPLVFPRRLSATAVTSALGLGSCCIWALSTTLLAVLAIVKGQGHRVYWTPDTESLGHSLPEVATQIAAVIPILATAYTCQMTVHHIMRDMQQFSRQRMAGVSAAAVGLCTLLFILVALGSCIIFGQQLPADVLQAFDAKALEPLLGPAAARVVYTIVRLSFLLSVCSIFPMQMAPYRESLARLCCGQELRGAPFYLLTYFSLALFYVVAMVAGSIWRPLQVIGATAGALIAFFFPAWITLRVLGRGELATASRPRYWRWNAWGLVVVGVVQAVTGLAAGLFLQQPGEKNGVGLMPMMP